MLYGIVVIGRILYSVCISCMCLWGVSGKACLIIIMPMNWLERRAGCGGTSTGWIEAPEWMSSLQSKFWEREHWPVIWYAIWPNTWINKLNPRRVRSLHQTARQHIVPKSAPNIEHCTNSQQAHYLLAVSVHLRAMDAVIHDHIGGNEKKHFYGILN